MKISVVIVTYNSSTLIDRCLQPLLNRANSDVQIVIWDNSSPDGTLEYVKSRYPEVQIRGDTGNLGFAAGNNAAFKFCEGDYILLLNPDAFLETFDQVQTLASYLTDNPDVAAVGPMLINSDGSHQVGDAGWSHTLTNVIGHSLFLHRILPGFKSIYLTRPGLLARKSVEVDWICGACMLVRRDVIGRVGGLDEEIFMYGEDVEWCDRMRRINNRLLYIPTVQVLHLQGGTQKDNEDTLFVSKKWIAALVEQIKTSSPRWKVFALKITLVLGFLLRALLYLFADLLRGRVTFHRSRAMFDYALYSLALK
jgi:N-acetylglucosaminyl-diphospho-decaprenol L-rhamnosyltransferase